MHLRETILRDRSGDHFSVPVMSLPVSEDADGASVRVRDVSENAIELLDGVGRRRIITYREKKIVRMETTISGARGLYERVDQRKDRYSFVSAIVEPGRMPRVATWNGELVVRVDRGLVNYVTSARERLYETADSSIVQERTLRSGARIFAWIGRDGRVRSKQIHDACGRRHFIAYDKLGLARVRLGDNTEISRGPFGVWETAEGDPVRKLELIEDGSIRWVVDRLMQEVRGDGTRACRIERDDFTEFVRFDAEGEIVSSIRASSDPSGAEKTIVRDNHGIASLRIATPRSDGGYDLRTIERARAGSKNPTWRISATSPPGTKPEVDRRALLPTEPGQSRYVIATIDELEDGIVFSFPDSTGMFVEHSDGRVEQVA